MLATIYVSRVLISLQRLYEQLVQCCQLSSFLVSHVMLRTQGSDCSRFSTMHGGHINLILLRKVATKVVRPSSDQESRCTDEDQSEETEIEH